MNTSGTPDDNQLKAYLLSELSDDERAAMEDRFIDDGLFDQLLLVEDEMYDAYARGALTGPRREYFERHFLAAAEQRRKFEIAKSLLNYRPPKPWLSWLTLSRPAVLIPVFSLALLLLAAPVMYRALRPNSRPPVQSSNKSGEPVIVSFALLPGQTRAAAEKQAFAVPSNAASVRLEAVLERNEHNSYRAVLQSVSGVSLWSQSGLPASDGSSGKMVPVVVPGSLLSSRDYILAIQAQQPGGEVVTIEEYTFRIQR